MPGICNLAAEFIVLWTLRQQGALLLFYPGIFSLAGHLIKPETFTKQTKTYMSIILSCLNFSPKAVKSMNMHIKTHTHALLSRCSPSVKKRKNQVTAYQF